MRKKYKDWVDWFFDLPEYSQEYWDDLSLNDPHAEYYDELLILIFALYK